MALTSDTSAAIKAREKVSYFAVNVGNIPIMTLIGSFLLIFYTDVAGLDPAAVGTMFLITRIFDGVNDPLMGFIIDHLPRTKWGRFRPYIAIGSIVCAVNFLLLWLGPSIATAGKLAIAYVSYFAIGITFDMMDIPLNALIPVMATKDRERTTLSIIKSLGYGAGSVLFTLPIIPVVQAFPTQRDGYHAVIIIAVIFIIALSNLGTAGIKERVSMVPVERYKAKDLGRILTLLPVIGLFLTTLMGSISGGTVNAIAIYYFTYVTGDPAFMVTFSFFTLLLGGLGIIPAMYLVRRMGNKQVWMAGTAAALVPSTIALFIPHDQPFLLLIIIGVGRVGLGFSGIVNYALQADIMDYVDWKRGHRTEGAIASIFSFITKAGIAIGAAIPGYVLAFTGYVPNQQVQSPAVTGGITFLFLHVPVIICVSSLLCMGFLYPISRDVSVQMQIDLAKKRAFR